MRKLPTRQVHLDFHTSEDIPGVGKKFDKAQFQQALRLGNLNSITVFAKCHHGWCYYPTQVGEVHPTMDQDFDLTGAMVDAAHEVGVAAPIYITVGWSARDAELHPDWRMVGKDGTPLSRDPNKNPGLDDPRPTCSWENLCPSGDYAQSIYQLTEEISQRYHVVDGLFYDIVYQHRACYCENCKRGMQALGLSPEKEGDAQAYYIRLHQGFAEKCGAILHRHHPEATVFFNSGGADIYRPEYHGQQSHYEMEDLPTVWGGYNKMPPRASFMRRYADKEFLGMTGKFHMSWGEFGGFKHPDALKAELCMMAMYGARCSVGDQMPPNGLMDLETYRLMGQAYRYLERIEPWSYDHGVTSTTKLGVYLSGDEAADEGLHNMLLESQLDFEIVIPGDELSAFAALVLPDCVKVTDAEAARIAQFAQTGGGVLFTGESLVKDSAFQIDAGVKYEGPAAFRQDYLRVTDQLGWVRAPFLCYNAAPRVKLNGGKALGDVYDPYFDRTYRHYCSHANTPYHAEPSGYVGAARKGNIVYFAHSLCTLYYKDGAQIFRDVLMDALRLVYTPNVRVALPSGGRVRLVHQGEAKRYVLHLCYASPIQRGRTSVLDDHPTFYQLPVELDIPARVQTVRIVPDGAEIPFTQEGNTLRFTVPMLHIHQAIACEYGA